MPFLPISFDKTFNIDSIEELYKHKHSDPTDEAPSLDDTPSSTSECPSSSDPKVIRSSIPKIIPNIHSGIVIDISPIESRMSVILGGSILQSESISIGVGLNHALIHCLCAKKEESSGCPCHKCCDVLSEMCVSGGPGFMISEEEERIRVLQLKEKKLQDSDSWREHPCHAKEGEEKEEGESALSSTRDDYIKQSSQDNAAPFTCFCDEIPPVLPILSDEQRETFCSILLHGFCTDCDCISCKRQCGGLLGALHRLSESSSLTDESLILLFQRIVVVGGIVGEYSQEIDPKTITLIQKSSKKEQQELIIQSQKHTLHHSLCSKLTQCLISSELSYLPPFLRDKLSIMSTYLTRTLRLEDCGFVSCSLLISSFYENEDDKKGKEKSGNLIDYCDNYLRLMSMDPIDTLTSVERAKMLAEKKLARAKKGRIRTKGKESHHSREHRYAEKYKGRK
ncbi:hypothetical protein ADUPG1_008085 [Aduncisulcus paluster]|uniref:Uncharacterized protein n=1 Tax=Aduncisulcus paluster TaxID=2918883 RepID=A0ABQ5KT66_9EUKA|nr:hypothetical protein ADUPG1_008085 [Aduncisulcus paluster]